MWLLFLMLGLLIKLTKILLINIKMEVGGKVWISENFQSSIMTI